MDKNNNKQFQEDVVKLASWYTALRKPRGNNVSTIPNFSDPLRLILLLQVYPKKIIHKKEETPCKMFPEAFLTNWKELLIININNY